jgi:colanic acid biosynthesis glycosyl transferase WcaI
MRVLIVNRHYGNEHVPTGRMAADLAAALLEQGHEVVVLAAPSTYVATAGESARADGVEVRHTVTLGEKYRLFSWILFLLQAWATVPFMRWDRCVLLTDPPFLAAISIPLRHFRTRNRRVYWWTMDLYPEMLVGSGRIRQSGWINAFLRGINRRIIRALDGVILLGECQLQRMRGYDTWKDDNFLIVPPWDKRPIRKVEPESNRFLAKYGLQSRKVALYAGNLGEGHTYLPLLEAARELQKAGRNDWSLVFVVRGSKKQALMKSAEGLPEIVVLDYQPVDWTSDLLWAADVHLITMNEQSKGLVVPSKLYGILQTEAPVLLIGPKDSDTAREIRRYGAGRDARGELLGRASGRRSGQAD